MNSASSSQRTCGSREHRSAGKLTVKIVGSEITLASQHATSERHTQCETLRAWAGDRRPNFDELAGDVLTPTQGGSITNGTEDDSASKAHGRQHDDASISWKARALAREAAHAARESERNHATTSQQSPNSTAATQSTAAASDDDGLDAKTRLLKIIVERFTGQKIRILSSSDLKQTAEPPAAVTATVSQPGSSTPQPQTASSVGWGVDYQYHEQTYQFERTDFSAEGTIQTADGQKISFKLNLTMIHERATETSIGVQAGDAARQAKDPLIVNFGGNVVGTSFRPAADLTSARFAFDIDADGKTDQVALAGPKSAFLALDKNGNGKIDEGTELFGAKTGEGFAELVALDSDHNNWIDEADAAFSQLRLWSKDAAGNDTLVGLKDRGIGAIYLGTAETPFAMRAPARDANSAASDTLAGATSAARPEELIARIRRSGIYLGESGAVGTIQQVDLTGYRSPTAAPSARSVS